MEVELDFEKRYRLVREVIETIVLTVLMFLIIRLAVQNFVVDGMSMEYSLHDQQLVLVDKWSYLVHPPTRGDVIVFVAPPQPQLDYVKRIIGLPGDIVTINDGVPTVNGVTLKEPYVDQRNLHAAPGDQNITNVLIPPGYYFVMGDNREHSSDSRYWGCLPRENIIGGAALVYWPFGQNNYGLLPNFSSVFNHVPDPKATTGNPCYMWNNGAKHASAPQSQPQRQGLDMNTAFLLVMPGLFVVYSKRERKRLPVQIAVAPRRASVTPAVCQDGPASQRPLPVAESTYEKSGRLRTQFREAVSAGARGRGDAGVNDTAVPGHSPGSTELHH